MQYCITFLLYLFSLLSKLMFFTNEMLGLFTFNYLSLTLPYITSLKHSKSL